MAKEQYQHYLLKELPERYHSLLDYRRAGIGERLVFEPYTKETLREPIDGCSTGRFSP